MRFIGLFIFLLMLFPLGGGAGKQPQVIVNTPAPVYRTMATPPVLQQKIDDIASENLRRDASEAQLQQTLNDDISLMRQRADSEDSRIGKLEQQNAMIFAVGGLAVLLLNLFAGVSIALSTMHHRENKETALSISTSLVDMGKTLAVLQSRLDHLENREAK